MHASQILPTCLSPALDAMHKDRVQSLLGAVDALLQGRRLVLMELARSYPGATRVRAPLKRIDRLLSNPHLADERPLLYAAMSSWLVIGAHPVIAIDWSSLDARERFHVLRAGIVLEGRTLTILEEVHPTVDHNQPRIERAFLKSLKALLPASCTPIIVTDAGFRSEWFAAVRALNWDYIGRVRGKISVRLANEEAWQSLKPLCAGASGKARCLGRVELGKAARFSCRLVRSKQASKGRVLLTKHGLPSRASRSLKAERRESEPCLLATSLTRYDAQRIVKCYRQRMQIEESFRDLKSERYGAGFDLSLTRVQPRIANLLLIHALATFVAYLVALSLSERKEQELTVTVGGVVSKRRHYSRVWLGWQVLRRRWLSIPPLHSLIEVLQSIRPFVLA